MPGASMPAAESQIIQTLASTFNVSFDDLSTPVLKAKSFLSSSTRLNQANDILVRADLGSGPGILDALKLLGGLYMGVEGVLIVANAGQLGVVVVEVLGLVTVSASTATLIGLGLAVLGGYLLYKGLQAMWPVIQRKLRNEFGSAWDVMFRSGSSDTFE